MPILLFPILVVALDHHGAERIPGHAHAVPDGEPLPPHLHGYQVPHVHLATATPVALPGAPAMVPAVPLAILTLLTTQALSAPLPNLASVVRARGEGIQRDRRRLFNQIDIRPLTPPPPA